MTSCQSVGDHNLPAAVSEIPTQNRTISFQLSAKIWALHTSWFSGSARIEPLVGSSWARIQSLDRICTLACHTHSAHQDHPHLFIAADHHHHIVAFLFRTSSFTPNRRQPPSGGLKTDLFSSSLPFRQPLSSKYMNHHFQSHSSFCRPSSISNGSLTPSSMYSSLSPESSGASTPSSSKSTDSENFWNQYRRSPPPISIPDMLRGLLKGKLRWQP